MTTPKQILELIAQGENAQIEFKSAAARPESVAREIVALANSLGGTVLIGVEDNAQISGLTQPDTEEWLSNILRHNIIPALNAKIAIVSLEDKQVAAVTVPKGPDKPYQTVDGKYWIRTGSTNRTATKEELSRLFQQAGLVHFDIAPVANTGFADLDIQAVGTYYQTYYDLPFAELDSAEQRNILRNADMLIEYESKEVATVGGLLLFGKQPQRRLPQSAIQFAVFKGTDVTADLADKKEVTGSLPEMIDKTVGLIQLFLPVPSVIEGTQRQESPSLPVKVIREALVNAVAHRDYSASHRKISVYLFNDHLEITSPGRLPNTLTLDKIRYGTRAA
jgi:ATP-dependent DNA helicase RecG